MANNWMNGKMETYQEAYGDKIAHYGKVHQSINWGKAQTEGGLRELLQLYQTKRENLLTAVNYSPVEVKLSFLKQSEQEKESLKMDFPFLKGFLKKLDNKFLYVYDTCPFVRL